MPQAAVDLGHGKRVDAPAEVRGRRRPDRRDRPGDRLVAIVERRGPQLKVVTGFPPGGRGADGGPGADVADRGARRMIEWFTWLQVAVAVVAGLLCIVLGLAGRAPNDLSLGSLALVEVLLIVQLVVALVAPAFGNDAVGQRARVRRLPRERAPPAAGGGLLGARRPQPLEHRRLRRRRARRGGHGLPHAADLDRAAGVNRRLRESNTT